MEEMYVTRFKKCNFQEFHGEGEHYAAQAIKAMCLMLNGLMIKFHPIANYLPLQNTPGNSKTVLIDWLVFNGPSKP